MIFLIYFLVDFERRGLETHPPAADDKSKGPQPYHFPKIPAALYRKG